MKITHLIIGNSRAWLIASLITLGILFGYWVSGTWLSNPSFEYVPPRFDQLQVTQGKLSFTRRSKSSGGEIVLQLENGEQLLLACNPPDTLPDACYYKKEITGWVDYRQKTTGVKAIVWWRPEVDLTKGGRVYQMRVAEDLFFTYQDQVEYYLKHYKKSGGRNNFLGFVLLILIALVIRALTQK